MILNEVLLLLSLKLMDFPLKKLVESRALTHTEIIFGNLSKDMLVVKRRFWGCKKSTLKLIFSASKFAE